MKFRLNLVLVCLLPTLAMSIGMAAQQASSQNMQAAQPASVSGGHQADCLQKLLGRPDLPLRVPKLPPGFMNRLCQSLGGAQTARPSRDVPDNNSYGTYITIDAPGDVYGTTVLEGINPRGDIVGAYYDSSLTIQTFEISDGVFRIVTPQGAVPGGFLVFATQMGINPQGDIVSSYVNASRDYMFGFVLSQGNYTLIDPPGADHSCIGTTVAGINASGDIVGSYPVPGGNCYGRGFLLSHGVYIDVNVPGAVSTGPAAINSKGDILGNYYDSNLAMHGFMLGNGTYTTFDVPGSDFDFFMGMNARGDIVGAECCVTPNAGFLLSHGTLTALAAPGAVLTFPFGIDSQGNIVGQYLDSDFVAHGFVLVKH
jgi:hypothetical protein